MYENDLIVYVLYFRYILRHRIWGVVVNFTDKKIVIFQCNISNIDSDIGHCIDVAKEVITHFGTDNILPYFVVTAESSHLQEAINRFKDKSQYAFTIDFDKQLQTFTNHSLMECLEQNIPLKDIYAAANIIFTIARPFPELTAKEKFLHKNVEIFNITEHCNTSLLGPAWSYPHFHHYVTGISKYDSGLMVRDLASDPVKALQSISDTTYLEKLGVTLPLTDEVALQFIKNNLVIPVYMDESQKHDLAPLMHLVSQSPLARKFLKIIFHVNQSAYDETLFNEMNAMLNKRPDTPKIQLLVGHHFKHPDDLQRVFQLSSGQGVAIVSSDKGLELAISSDLLPLYLPLAWKRPMHRSLHELVQDLPDLNNLQAFLSKTTALKKMKTTEHQTMIQAMQDDDSVSQSLNTNAVLDWRELKRPLLLEKSFYNILHNQILDHQPAYDLEQKARNALMIFQEDKYKIEKILNEINEVQNGKQTYVVAFMNALTIVANDERCHFILKHLNLDVESVLFAVKNYLNLSPEFTCISEQDKKNLSADWMSELKFIWTQSQDDQIDLLKKVILWANQLPEKCRYGVLMCICRELI